MNLERLLIEYLPPDDPRCEFPTARALMVLIRNVLVARELSRIAMADLEQKERHLEEAKKRQMAGTATDFDVLAAQDTVATAQTSKKAIAEQLASAKRNFEVGTATITDTREAQARFDLATARELVADNDLRKVGTMTEAAGIEVRYPLLDDRMVAFANHLPVDYKVRGQKLRWFFKEALTDLLPEKIINKSKHGFGLPFGVWSMQYAPLGELVGDSLSDFKRRGWI